MPNNHFTLLIELLLCRNGSLFSLFVRVDLTPASGELVITLIGELIPTCTHCRLGLTCERLLLLMLSL